jgi:hypothetical protein|tara:strand:- start:148 stop:522 length:375 start_codon:yes stop_codon:yes gene_type:complete
MAAPLVAGMVVRTTGGLVLRRVAATSMGNALTGLGTSFMLAERFSDDAGNVYEIVGQESPAGRSSGRRDSVPIPRGKKVKQTRKVSRYQKVFGKHLKALKRKHPRTQISTLMKRAHRLTKRELK